ncbi:hypothetical protein BDR03DRAFT_967905 [Suillus americanus]|nr:hypothetical protein BDR03DRAFT_967905 [Suillus americanus]
MTVVSNDPIWWPFISSTLFLSYWLVAAGVVMVYDWVLTLGQEIELIWRQHWSLMSILYIVIRYIGLPYSVCELERLILIRGCSLIGYSGNIVYYAICGTNVAVTAMLGIIIIARLHAMYQRSRIMLIILVVVFLAVNIACGVIAAIGLKDIVAEELILYGMYTCDYGYKDNVLILFAMIWMLNIVWEVLALSLSVCIAVKHFRLTIGDCFRVLIESHVLYFASFVCVSCFQLVYLSPQLVNSYSTGVLLDGLFEVFLLVQMFVLGPRLILSVREYHAKLVADSDTETSMASIVFQERVHVGKCLPSVLHGEE